MGFIFSQKNRTLRDIAISKVNCALLNYSITRIEDAILKANPTPDNIKERERYNIQSLHDKILAMSEDIKLLHISQKDKQKVFNYMADYTLKITSEAALKLYARAGNEKMENLLEDIIAYKSYKHI